MRLGGDQPPIFRLAGRLVTGEVEHAGQAAADVGLFRAFDRRDRVGCAAEFQQHVDAGACHRLVRRLPIEEGERAGQVLGRAVRFDQQRQRIALVVGRGGGDERLFGGRARRRPVARGERPLRARQPIGHAAARVGKGECRLRTPEQRDDIGDATASVGRASGGKGGEALRVADARDNRQPQLDRPSRRRIACGRERFTVQGHRLRDTAQRVEQFGAQPVAVRAGGDRGQRRGAITAAPKLVGVRDGFAFGGRGDRRPRQRDARAGEAGRQAQRQQERSIGQGADHRFPAERRRNPCVGQRR